jgi:hypothetical protein
MRNKFKTASVSKKNETHREKILQNLRTIPGVGKSISVDLWNLGIRSVGALKNKNPEMLYRKHCIQAGQPVDRCLLYVFRCAVYYASHRQHNPELLLWWNWKD